MKKIIVSLLLVFVLSGCNFTDFIIDPVRVVINPDNASKSYFNESDNQSPNSNSKSSSDNSSEEIKDVTRPTFYVAIQNTYKFNNRFSVDINNLENYDFRAQSIGLSANDYLTDLSSSITYDHSGLSVSEDGRTMWYVTYYVYDDAGNGSKLDVGFPAYYTIYINESNFYDYFELKRTILEDGYDLNGIIIDVITELKPTYGLKSIRVLESDLEVNHTVYPAWYQETFQGGRYPALGGEDTRTLISSIYYTYKITTSQIIPENIIIDSDTFAGVNRLQHSSTILPKTAYTHNNFSGSSRVYTQDVKFEDISFNYDGFQIVGSMTIRVDY
jgi:hypothetical protein